MNAYVIEYRALQRECARMGHTDTPISADEYRRARRAGVTRLAMYGLACDMASGACESLREAIECHIEH